MTEPGQRAREAAGRWSVRSASSEFVGQSLVDMEEALAAEVQLAIDQHEADGWVSVEDGLPEDRAHVLIGHDRTGHVGEARWWALEGLFEPSPEYGAERPSGRWAIMPKPTHWRPLPRPLW